MSKTAADLAKAANSSFVAIDCASERGVLGGKTAFIDVREPPEWEDGTISDARRIPRGVLEWPVESEASLANRQVPIIVYCKSGRCSALAAPTL